MIGNEYRVSIRGLSNLKTATDDAQMIGEEA
jgi:hypothetical protein